MRVAVLGAGNGGHAMAAHLTAEGHEAVLFTRTQAKVAAIERQGGISIEGAGASGEVLGLDKAWLRRVVAAVGNYGEMFETNVGTTSPLGMNRGINALWKKGGILFAPPMW